MSKPLKTLTAFSLIAVACGVIFAVLTRQRRIPAPLPDYEPSRLPSDQTTMMSRPETDASPRLIEPEMEPATGKRSR